MQRQEDRLQQPLLQEVALQRALLTKMMLASVVCCVIGAVGMGLFRHYLLMGIFLAAIAVIYVCALLAKWRVLSAETAALMPMLVFCFVYTPASWYTFGGLLGSTPYLAIIFAAMIALTNYRHGGYLVLGAYLLMLAGLTADWFSRYGGSPSLEFALSTLTAFVLALSLIIVFLEKTKQKNSEISRSLLDSSICDDLTKLYNRRAVELIFGMVEERYQNKEMDYTVLMLDIDRFKHANDQYGHAEGDAALQAVAACIQCAIRTTDYAVRYGGDEFLIILPLATQEGARLIRERIGTSLREVKTLPFPVSVSTGSARRSECEHRDALIALADARMYEAKRTLQETEHMDDTEAIGPKMEPGDLACGE